MAAKNKRSTQVLLSAGLTLLLAVTLWSGIRMHTLSTRRAKLKSDYSEINNITHGLLSVDAWKDHIQDILNDQIENFTLTPAQEADLRNEINKVLNDLITEADTIIQHDQNTLAGKIRKLAINTFVNVNDVRKDVPKFSETIIKEIEKPDSKEKLKGLAEEKLNEYAAQTHDSTSDTSHLNNLLTKYKANTIADFNGKVTGKIDLLELRSYKYSFIIVGCLLFVLLLWYLLRRQNFLHKPLFVFTVLLAIIVLVIGLTSPMIEIDARIKKVDFLLIGEHLQFNDQVLFYQSKSILEVVRILIKTGKIDTMLVGVLILIFSVLFPFSKLIATEIYLLTGNRFKKNKILNFLAFNSGKWSMADVTVVAVFMAYVGFKGIINNQLEPLNIKTESLTSIATNETSLQPGFILFLSFVLYGLVISEILKRIIPHSSPNKKD